MNQKEAALARRILASWYEGFGQQLLQSFGISASLPDVVANVRLPATDIAWRELDVLSEPNKPQGIVKLIGYESAVS